MRGVSERRHRGEVGGWKAGTKVFFFLMYTTLLTTASTFERVWDTENNQTRDRAAQMITLISLRLIIHKLGEANRFAASTECLADRLSRSKQ